MQRVYFVYEREKKDPLFERSRLEISYLNGEIPKASQDHIPLHEEEEFEEQLERKDRAKYHIYILMKIYHFLDIMWNLKIVKMGADFIKDHQGVTWLVNISRLQYEQVQKDAEATEQKSMENKAENKAENKNSGGEVVYLNGKPMRISGRSKSLASSQSYKVMNNAMQQHYDGMKNTLGVNLEESNDEEDKKITREAFVRLNNQTATMKVSDVLPRQFTVDSIRNFYKVSSQKLIRLKDKEPIKALNWNSSIRSTTTRNLSNDKTTAETLENSESHRMTRSHSRKVIRISHERGARKLEEKHRF